MLRAVIIFVQAFFLIQTILCQNLLAVYPDVEQGSSILIVAPDGTAVLVDAGSEISPTDTDLVPFLVKMKGRGLFSELRATIITHYDEDHIGAMDRVLTSGLLEPDGFVFDRGDYLLTKDTAAYRDYIAAAGLYSRTEILPGQRIDIGGGAVIDVVAVNGRFPDGSQVDLSTSTSPENALSAAMVVRYGDFDLWIGGDLTGEGSQYYPNVEGPAGLFAGDVDVYTVNHHGSRGSSALSFLSEIRPKLSICQNGIDNGYGHPNSEAVSRIRNFGVFVGLNPGPGDDPRVDNGLAYGFSDPDGNGGIPGTVMLATDGRQYLVTGEDFPALHLATDTDLSGFPVGDLPPLISDIHQAKAVTNPEESVEVSCEVLDENLSRIEIAYETNGIPQDPISMTPISETRFVGSIPGQMEGTSVTFRIETEDTNGQAGYSSDREFWVQTTQAVGNLLLSEVFYDHSGADDGKEWVELFNAGTSSINLANYSLGYGGDDYTYGKVQLSGTVMPGAFFVVGGPSKTAENGNPFYAQAANLNPDIQNADGDGKADGVALFNVPSSQVTSITQPVDAVIYGGVNESGLIDETGASPSPDVRDVSAGYSIERTSLAGSWRANSNPDPGFSVYLDVIEEPTLIFTQWLNGMIGSEANATRIILKNNSDVTESGEIRFQNKDGDGTAVPVNGQMRQKVDFTIPPWGTYELMTDGTGTLQSGTIEVYSDRGDLSLLEGTEIFEVLGNSVSVPDSVLRAKNQAYVSLNDEENTGVALYNPGSSTITIDAYLVDSDGQLGTTREITVEPGQQIVGFIDEAALFANYFATHPKIYNGTLNLVVRGGGEVSVVGLLQKKRTGALVAVSTSVNTYMPN